MALSLLSIESLKIEKKTLSMTTLDAQCCFAYCHLYCVSHFFIIMLTVATQNVVMPTVVAPRLLSIESLELSTNFKTSSCLQFEKYWQPIFYSCCPTFGRPLHYFCF